MLFRSPSSIIRSVALVICCGRNEGEVALRASNIGRKVDELTKNGLAGTPSQIVEKIQTFREIGVSRIYPQILDMNDLDHISLIANEVLSKLK